MSVIGSPTSSKTKLSHEAIFDYIAWKIDGSQYRVARKDGKLGKLSGVYEEEAIALLGIEIIAQDPPAPAWKTQDQCVMTSSTLYKTAYAIE